MRIVFRRALPLLLIPALLLGGCAADAATTTAKPWPSHAPEATPYVRVMQEAPAPTGEGAAADFSWDSIYESFGHFYAKNTELEFFKSLPQDEVFGFVPHSEAFSLDAGDALRTAQLFAAQEGVEAEVLAEREIVDGMVEWDYLTVVRMTPARLFSLSEELDERFFIEQLYEGVEERFDRRFWPDGLSDRLEAELRESYVPVGGLWFDAQELEGFRALPQDEPHRFWVRRYSPDGWEEDANSALWSLRGQSGCKLSIAWQHTSQKSLLLLETTPARLFALADSLGGYLLITEPNDALLAEYEELVELDGEAVG